MTTGNDLQILLLLRHVPATCVYNAPSMFLNVDSTLWVLLKSGSANISASVLPGMQQTILKVVWFDSSQTWCMLV